MPTDPFHQPTKTQAPAASGRERRRDPRYPLIAEARVIDIGSGSEFKVRISELSVSGCYLDFLNPIPDGTDIVVKISRDTGIFETNAKVVYNHPGMGLGIRFIEPKPTQQAILNRWIAELAAASES
jgi:PilZ domain